MKNNNHGTRGIEAKKSKIRKCDVLRGSRKRITQENGGIVNSCNGLAKDR